MVSRIGFVGGEGSFNVVTVEKMSNAAPTLSISYKVWLYFQITQHSRDILLMERIVSFLGWGSVKKGIPAQATLLILS